MRASTARLKDGDFFDGDDAVRQSQQNPSKKKKIGPSKITWLNSSLGELSSPQLGDDSGVRDLKEQVRQLSKNGTPQESSKTGAPFPMLLSTNKDAKKNAGIEKVESIGNT